MTSIARAGASDWPDIWTLLEPVFRAGETYPYPPDISEAQARVAWMEAPLATFVARADGGLAAGTYYLKANQPGLGAHVCNCGYVVGRRFRGQGIAAGMCEHSQREALRQGFRAMQFNLVVSTNEGAARLWKRLGFGMVGTLPGAFHHRALGDIDAYVMYKRLAG